MDPLASRINHSCQPNAIIIYDGPKMEVKALETFQAGDEILISYIDELVPFAMRQAELKQKFHFTCACSRCALRQSAPKDIFIKPASAMDPKIRHLADKYREMFAKEEWNSWWSQHYLGPSEDEKRLSALQTMGNLALITKNALTKEEAMDKVATALDIVQDSNIWPLDRYPLPALLDHYIQDNIETGRMGEAMKASMKRYFVLDPVMYPQHWNPVCSPFVRRFWLC
jgi:hypothetical protein